MKRMATANQKVEVGEMKSATDIGAEPTPLVKSPGESHFPPGNQRNPYPGSGGPNLALMKPLNCPRCGSDRIQKARILRRAGIPISTEVAKRISPPVEPTSAVRQAGWLSIYIGALPLIIGIYTRLNSHVIHADEFALFLQTMGVILVFLGISLLALSQIELNAKRPKYKEDYGKWEHLWYCSHCKNTFYDA